MSTAKDTAVLRRSKSDSRKKDRRLENLGTVCFNIFVSHKTYPTVSCNKGFSISFVRMSLS